MTDHGDISSGEDQASLVRLATLVIGSAEIIAFLLFVHLNLQSGDPTTTSAAEAALLTAPLAGLTLPGLLLAWLSRAPWVALGLVGAALPMAVATWAWA